MSDCSFTLHICITTEVVYFHSQRQTSLHPPPPQHLIERPAFCVLQITHENNELTTPNGHDFNVGNIDSAFVNQNITGKVFAFILTDT